MSPVHTTVYAALLFIPFIVSDIPRLSSTLCFFFRRFFFTFSRNFLEYFRIVRINVIGILLIDNITRKYHDDNNKSISFSNDFINLLLLSCVYI